VADGRAAGGAVHDGPVIVDCAAYVDGRRVTGRLGLGEVAAWRGKEDAFVWLGLRMPTAEEAAQASEVFGLHPLASEDAMSAHDLPKLEAFAGTLLLVMRTAHYNGAQRAVRLGELAVLCGERFVITVRHGHASPLDRVRAEMEADPERLAGGPATVLHAIVDRVVDDYRPVLHALDRDVSAVEKEVFSDSAHSPTRRIYTLLRELLSFEEAVEPLHEPLSRLARPSGMRPWVTPEATPWFQDVVDHLERVEGRAVRIRALLAGALDANLTQVSVRQNEDMRKISAWVAIAAVPTMVAGIYGMNFRHMPELGWAFGYPLVLGVTAAACLWLYRSFRNSGWL
jgi:magnesium transporter